MICNTYVQFFQTMADTTKLSIINSLLEKPMSVGDLCEKLKLEQSRVSHNLRTLKKRGFVISSPAGKQRIYSVDNETIVPLLKLIRTHVDKYYHTECKCSGTSKKKRWEGAKA